jgi:hypothetical protein
LFARARETAIGCKFRTSLGSGNVHDTLRIKHVVKHKKISEKSGKCLFHCLTLFLSKNKQIIYENAYIHIMEDTFPLGGHHPQHKKDSCTGYAAEGCDRLHGRKNGRQTAPAGRMCSYAGRRLPFLKYASYTARNGIRHPLPNRKAGAVK